ncbi:type II toxin-antitoxin system death-on-curing family toxin [Spirosoma areae]
MIDIADVLTIHQVLINDFGGSSGIRDQGLLQSAIERPFSGIGETLFYLTPEEKAGAILENIVKNHPFVDGNKRTGYVLMRLLLMQSGKDITATQEEKYDFVIQVASGRLDFNQIIDWI